MISDGKLSYFVSKTLYCYFASYCLLVQAASRDGLPIPDSSYLKTDLLPHQNMMFHS